MAGFPWVLCCCECEDCSFCPGETDRVWIVLTGTTADGEYEGVWNGTTGWDFDFGVCQTELTCNSDAGGLNWSLFADAACPIGGRCEVGGVNEGSPLVITPAPDCDNCGLELPNGTLAIHWKCTNPPALMMRAMATTETTSDPTECVYRGEQIGTKTCDRCGQRGKTIPVYQCELLGTPCVWNWWTNRAKEREGTTACITCKERTLADGTKPWDEV